MTKAPDPRTAEKPGPKGTAKVRDDRLKAALKANMARRKAQARARATGDAKAGAADPTGPQDDRQHTSE